MSYQSADRTGPALQAGVQGGAGTGTQAPTTPFLLALFFVSLVVPLQFFVGTWKLSPSTVSLLILFVPSLIRVLGGHAGPLRLPDYAVVMLCLWSTLSFMVIHGLARMVETIGIMWLETLGAYLIGRAYIRTPQDLYASTKFLVLILAGLAPFALVEALTGRNITLEMFDVLGTVYPDVLKDKRLGFDRVQGPFAHPILFGVFFGALVGLVHYVLGYGDSVVRRNTRTLFVAVISGLSLSSGPLSAIVFQYMMIVWDTVLRTYRRRWVLLGSLTGLAYVSIDLLSSRSPFAVFIGYAALNPATAYNRLNIWYWGMINVNNYPIFGLGMRPWVRQPWMPASVDMHWLLPAMRHGYPAWIFYGLLLGWLAIRLARLKTESEMIDSYRKGYLISFFGIFMAGWTVYFWDSVVVFVMFFLGAGVWFVNYTPPATDDDAPEAPETSGGSRYTRFGNDTAPATPPSRPGPRNGPAPARRDAMTTRSSFKVGKP